MTLLYCADGHEPVGWRNGGPCWYCQGPGRDVDVEEWRMLVWGVCRSTPPVGGVR